MPSHRHEQCACRRARRSELPPAAAPAVPLEGEDEKHDFIVYLPPMYDEQPDRRFPLLYMQDGQNLFDPETSFCKGNYWHMGETADALILAGEIEPLIIVGIYNTGKHRIDEYTPVEDKRLGGGQADAYGQMLVEELKPFVDHAYRTLPGDGIADWAARRWADWSRFISACATPGCSASWRSCRLRCGGATARS